MRKCLRFSFFFYTSNFPLELEVGRWRWKNSRASGMLKGKAASRTQYISWTSMSYLPSPEELYMLHPLACKNPVLMPIQFILICLLGLYSCYFQHVAFLCDCMKRAYWVEMDKGTSDLRLGFFFFSLQLGGASGSLSNIEMIPRI